MLERRLEAHRLKLVMRTRARIAERLRPLCAHVPEEEFSALVAKMAEVEIKYAHRRLEDLIGTDLVGN